MKAILSIILNPNVPFARLANAVGHICLGMGKNVDRSIPIEIAIRVAPQPEKMYEIRKYFYEQSEGNLLPTKVMDFTSSMTGETYREQLEKTAVFGTDELEYFAVAALTVPEVAAGILNTCLPLVKYNDHVITIAGNESLQGTEGLPTTSDNVGLSIVVDKKSEPTDVLLGIAISSLTMGANIPEELLKLLNFKDKDDVEHAQISAHSYVMLQAKNASQLQTLASNIQDEAALVSYLNPEPRALCLFGFSDQRRASTSKCSLLTSDKSGMQLALSAP